MLFAFVLAGRFKTGPATPSPDWLSDPSTTYLETKGGRTTFALLSRNTLEKLRFFAYLLKVQPEVKILLMGG